MSSIYKEIIQSKDNLQIPVFKSGKTMHSKYAPLREAETFGTSLSENSRFTIILGLGGGYHIESFSLKNPDNIILVIEESIDDINFLSEIECVKKIKNNKNVIIIEKTKIRETLTSKYLPAISGGIDILFNRPWFEENNESANIIIEDINKTLKDISRDYSVQTHFGFIWQKNIISNLKILSEKKLAVPNFDTSKKAAVIAAGPSLDSTISKIKTNRNDYVIFSTDTALDVLCKHEIKVDAVVSIDGQNISYKHFIGYNNIDTFFIFDLQSNFNAVKYVSSFTDKIIFVKSGHPFCNYAEMTAASNPFLQVDCGAGTVTIAAIDFASKAGFSDFEVFGADFSYQNNKPYTKGTYLDKLYRHKESKVSNSENQFTNLLYRTEIKKKDNIIETDILNSYRETFIQWIKNNNYCYSYEDKIYYVKSNTSYKGTEKFHAIKFDLNKLLEDIKNQESLLNCKNESSDLYNIKIALLPFIAYLRFKDPSLSYGKALNLAIAKILEYN